MLSAARKEVHLQATLATVKICEISRITSGPTRDNSSVASFSNLTLLKKIKKGGGKGKKKRKKPFPLGSQMPIEDNTFVSRLKRTLRYSDRKKFFVLGRHFF